MNLPIPLPTCASVCASVFLYGPSQNHLTRCKNQLRCLIACLLTLPTPLPQTHIHYLPTKLLLQLQIPERLLVIALLLDKAVLVAIGCLLVYFQGC